MRSLIQRLSSCFSGKPRLAPAELQAAFRGHYRDFRALLTANNNALELMAEMEQVFGAGHAFGMAFIRGTCTALSVNIYKMIHHLISLADGRYTELRQPFATVTREIEELLARRPVVATGDFVLPMTAIDKDFVDQVGEKMANLGEVGNRVGLRIPEGFVMTAAAAGHLIEANDLQDEINRRMKGLDPDNLEDLYTVSAGIQKLIGGAALPSDLEAAILNSYQKLCDGMGGDVPVALRSSALGEDNINVSFAGQYRTQLNVSREFIGQTYKEIVAGIYKSQAIVYRQQRGYRHQDVHMCVGCLVMVDAVVSGVLYSRAPDDPRSPFVMIQAAPGLAVQVVDGSAVTDLFLVSRIPPYPVQGHRPASFREGKTAAPVLSLSQTALLAEAGLRLEEHFGVPQDIEWSIDRRGRLFILQSRPLSRGAPVPARPDPAVAQGGGDLAGPLLSGGVCASQGVGCGPVFKVLSTLDLLRFPKGAVLVIKTPYPDWASILNRAAAVVSETGQPAAHLATVAREFGVPAIFAQDGALAVLEQGRLITVDATAAKVYDGRVEDLLAKSPSRPNLMAGSPVYNILREILQRVTPLNLTDPASPFFTPASCQTLHDLTRFCHEKAVVEMFTFGERYGFDDKAAKQLVVDAPYQWWVIDLDNGFAPDFDPESRYVHIDQIVSAPMRAIWKGMTAFPWAGPPPVSLGGFGSIIFQSTRNPQLDPAVRSSMASKNYFLISKNFCNLSVRLGYHFALVEANLGEFLTENYVSFQFKGGAADEKRRRRRAELICEILRSSDFRVEMKVDAVTARIEKKPAPYLLERLQILGYLLIHTRQIDMVMGDVDMVGQYRKKIMDGIAGLFACPSTLPEESQKETPDAAGYQDPARG